MALEPQSSLNFEEEKGLKSVCGWADIIRDLERMFEALRTEIRLLKTRGEIWTISVRIDLPCPSDLIGLTVRNFRHWRGSLTESLRLETPSSKEKGALGLNRGLRVLLSVT